MEERLASKLEVNSKAVGEAVKLAQASNDALETLEEKVDNNDERLREMVAKSEECVRQLIEANEARVMDVVKDRLKGMVDNQLREAGFDPELTTRMMGTPASKLGSMCKGAGAGGDTLDNRLYASVLNLPKRIILGADKAGQHYRSDRREERFWECRRSLRVWPVKGVERRDLEDFLVRKL